MLGYVVIFILSILQQLISINNLTKISLKVSLQRCVMKVKINFLGGLRIFCLAGKGAAGQISLRNTGVAECTGMLHVTGNV